MNNQTTHDTNNTEKPQHISFLLRMWCADEAGCSIWRASLEMPETGKRIGFPNLEQLFIYLIDLSESQKDVHDKEDKE